MSTPAAAPAAGGAPSAPSTPSASSSAPSSTPAPSTSSTSPASSVSESGTPNVQSGGDPGAPKPSTDSAADQAKKAAAAAEAERKWKLKVNGQERELTEQEMLRRASLGYGAEERLAEAAEMRKQAEAVIKALRENPMEVLMHPDLGLNFRELAENYLAGELKKEMMPPEIRELEELREFKRKQEEQAQQAEQQKMTQAQQAEFAKLQQRAAQEYDTKISEVLRQADLPKSPETVKHVAMVLRDALQKGYDLDIATAVDMVRENQVNSLRSFTSSLKGESLVKFLGDDIVKELRQHDLARIKAKLEQQQIDPPQAANPGPATQEKEPQFLKPDDWKEYIRRKAGV